MLVGLDSLVCLAANDAEGRGAAGVVLMIGTVFCLDGLLDDAGDVLVEEEERNGDQRANIERVVDVLAMDSLSMLSLWDEGGDGA